jgi:hypothetical protein
MKYNEFRKKIKANKNVCFLCGKPTTQKIKGLPMCEVCIHKIFQEDFVYAK